MAEPRSRIYCCGASLRRGALIYGYLHLIGTVGVMIACGVGLRYATSQMRLVSTEATTIEEEDYITFLQELVEISVLVFMTAVVNMAFTFALIKGIRKGNAPVMLLWVAMQVMLMADALGIIIVEWMLVTEYTYWLIPVALAIMTYAAHSIVVVSSYYLEMMAAIHQPINVVV